MKVTSVTLNLNVPANRRFKGWAKIVLDEVLMIAGIRLYIGTNRETGEEVRYIRFPDRRPPLSSTDGEYVSVPIVNTQDPTLRNEIVNAVFDAYENHPKTRNGAEVAQ
jgi:hypothetical protein